MEIRHLPAAKHLPGRELRRASASTVELVLGATRVGSQMAAGKTDCLKAMRLNQAELLVVDEEGDPETTAELVRLAEAVGCRVETAKQSDALVRLGGVACLLRYQAPEFWYG